MKIRHTPNEYYCLYTYLPCKSVFNHDIRRWFPYKHYSSKQAALNAIKRIRIQNKHLFDNRLIFKIVWYPYPFANDEESIIVYNEDIKNE